MPHSGPTWVLASPNLQVGAQIWFFPTPIVPPSKKYVGCLPLPLLPSICPPRTPIVPHIKKVGAVSLPLSHLFQVLGARLISMGQVPLERNWFLSPKTLVKKRAILPQNTFFKAKSRQILKKLPTFNATIWFCIRIWQKNDIFWIKMTCFSAINVYFYKDFWKMTNLKRKKYSISNIYKVLMPKNQIKWIKNDNFHHNNRSKRCLIAKKA